MSRIIFPLRTSVELFRDPMSVITPTRAKEAAILYDELVFEAGLYEIGITEQGSFANWRSPGGLTSEDLASSRRLPESGSGMEISFGLQPGPGEPAPPEAMRAFFGGPLTASYVAEWHSGVIDELRKISPPWAGITVWGESDPKLDPLRASIRDAQAALEQTHPLDQAQSPMLRDFTIKTLARDAVVASSMQAAMSVTSLFTPLIDSLGADPDPSGRTALSILAPNVGSLSWESIAEFREHGGAMEARGKLREFEERALAAEPDDPLECQRETFRAVSEALMSVIRDLSPKLGLELG